MDAPTLAVIVCTRDRPRQLAHTLDALQCERAAIDELVVVDQSAEPLAAQDGVTVIRDGGRGLSRARNLALARTSAAWLAFVDDDCRPQPGWGAALREEIAAHPDVAMICPRVDAGPLPGGDYLEVTTFPVARAALRRGRRTHPARLGFGVCCVVRRDVAERLGGWDERLGPGAAGFPAADDMDFNYRVLRSGGAAWVTPRPRAVHDQWRRADELPALHRGYLAAWCGFAVKTLRTGAPVDGARLLAIGMVDVADALADALRRPSRLRARLAAAKAAGFAGGTARALLRRW
jgi:GT2 family glycosyltransferase